MNNISSLKSTVGKNAVVPNRNSAHKNLNQHNKFHNLTCANNSEHSFVETGILQFNLFDDAFDQLIVREYLHKVLPSDDSNYNADNSKKYESVTLDENHEVVQFLIQQLRHQIQDIEKKYRFKVSAQRIHHYGKEKLKFSTHAAEAFITLEPICPHLIYELRGQRQLPQLFSIISSNHEFAKSIEPYTRDIYVVDTTHNVTSSVINSHQLSIYIQHSNQTLEENELEEDKVAKNIKILQQDCVTEIGSNYTQNKLFITYQVNKKYVLLFLKDYTKDYPQISIDVNKDYSETEFENLLKHISYNMPTASHYIMHSLEKKISYINQICGIDTNSMNLSILFTPENQTIENIIQQYIPENIESNIQKNVRILKQLYPHIDISEEQENNPLSIVDILITLERQTLLKAVANKSKIPSSAELNKLEIQNILQTLTTMRLVLANKADSILVISTLHPQIKIDDDISDENLIIILKDLPEIIKFSEQLHALQKCIKLYVSNKADVIEFMQELYGNEDSSFNEEIDTVDKFKHKVISLIAGNNNQLNFSKINYSLKNIIETKEIFTNLISDIQNNDPEQNINIQQSINVMINTVYPQVELANNDISFNVIHQIINNNGSLSDLQEMFENFSLLTDEPQPLAHQVMMLNYLYPSINLSTQANIREFVQAIHQAVELSVSSSNEVLNDASDDVSDYDANDCSNFASIVNKIQDEVTRFQWIIDNITNAKTVINYLYPNNNLNINPSIIDMIDFISKNIGENSDEYDVDSHNKMSEIKNLLNNVSILTKSKKDNILLLIRNAYPKYNIASSTVLSHLTIEQIEGDDAIKIAENIAQQYNIAPLDVLFELAKEVGIINRIEQEIELGNSDQFINNLTFIYNKYLHIDDIDFSTIPADNLEAIVSSMYQLASLLQNNSKNKNFKDLTLSKIFFQTRDFNENSKAFLFENMTQNDFSSNGLLYIGLGNSVEGSLIHKLRNNNIKIPPLVSKIENYLPAAPEYATGLNDYFRITVGID